MNDRAQETAAFGVKLALGVGPTSYGLFTLNNMALMAGIFCSLVVAGHSLWKWWCDVQDRRARLAKGG